MFQLRMSVFFNAYIMMGCLCNFLLMYSIFVRPPFKTRRSHLNDTKFFLSLAVFWLLFGTLKGSKGLLAFLVLRLGPKKLKINLGEPPKVLREAPCQLAVSGLTFEPETLETQSRALKTCILP